MSTLIRIESITQLHELIGYEKPKHPQISLIEYGKIIPQLPMDENLKISTGFYSIGLKEHPCEMKYGRKYYDFHEGSLVFMAPGQTFSAIRERENIRVGGWGLFFHPDLIRKSPLGEKMKEYSYFSYDVHEALHLSDREKQTITSVVRTIEEEYSQNLDSYSRDLILSNLELLLNYCNRFYGRQFLTRTHVNKDVVSRFESFLAKYFDSDRPQSEGLPTVKFCAKEMGYSSNYLSDMLKKETGKNTQEHIHFHLIEKAKNMLLGTEEPVSRIAYTLGFEYPQHFSKLFKSKTGMSPAAYRN